MLRPKLDFDYTVTPIWREGDDHDAPAVEHARDIDVGLELRPPRLNDSQTTHERDILWGRVGLYLYVTRSKGKIQSIDFNLMF